jgi:hypothetical protein
LLPGADGRSRVAKVRVREGVLLRPVQRLFPMEISSKDLPPVSKEVIQKSKQSMLNEEQNQLTTRAGRKVKKPHRYGQD